MTFLVERVAALREYLEHLRRIRAKVTGPTDLRDDLTLRNDVVHSLFMVAQLVIDIAGELSANGAQRFETYRQAIQNLSRDHRFSAELVAALVPLAGFRNVVVHDYIAVEYEYVMKALNDLAFIDEFARIVTRGLKPPATPDREMP